MVDKKIRTRSEVLPDLSSCPPFSCFPCMLLCLWLCRVGLRSGKKSLESQPFDIAALFG